MTELEKVAAYKTVSYMMCSRTEKNDYTLKTYTLKSRVYSLLYYYIVSILLLLILGKPHFDISCFYRNRLSFLIIYRTDVLFQSKSCKPQKTKTLQYKRVRHYLAIIKHKLNPCWDSSGNVTMQ